MSASEVTTAEARLSAVHGGRAGLPERMTAAIKKATASMLAFVGGMTAIDEFHKPGVIVAELVTEGVGERDGESFCVTDVVAVGVVVGDGVADGVDDVDAPGDMDGVGVLHGVGVFDAVRVGDGEDDALVLAVLLRDWDSDESALSTMTDEPVAEFDTLLEPLTEGVERVDAVAVDECDAEDVEAGDVVDVDEVEPVLDAEREPAPGDCELLAEKDGDGEERDDMLPDAVALGLSDSAADSLGVTVLDAVSVAKDADADSDDTADALMRELAVDTADVVGDDDVETDMRADSDAVALKVSGDADALREPTLLAESAFDSELTTVAEGVMVAKIDGESTRAVAETVFVLSALALDDDDDDAQRVDTAVEDAQKLLDREAAAEALMNEPVVAALTDAEEVVDEVDVVVAVELAEKDSRAVPLPTALVVEDADDRALALLHADADLVDEEDVVPQVLGDDDVEAMLTLAFGEVLRAALAEMGEAEVNDVAVPEAEPLAVATALTESKEADAVGLDCGVDVLDALVLPFSDVVAVDEVLGDGNVLCVWRVVRDIAAEEVTRPVETALPDATKDPDTVDVVERDVSGDTETRELKELIAVADGELVIAPEDEPSGEIDVTAVVVDDADGDGVEDVERDRRVEPVGKMVTEPVLDSRALLETLVVRETVALPRADAVTDPVSDTAAVELALLLLTAVRAALAVVETLPLSLS